MEIARPLLHGWEMTSWRFLLALSLILGACYLESQPEAPISERSEVRNVYDAGSATDTEGEFAPFTDALLNVRCRVRRDCPSGTHCERDDVIEGSCGLCSTLGRKTCTVDTECGPSFLCQTALDDICGSYLKTCGPRCASDDDCEDTQCVDGRCMPQQHCTLFGGACDPLSVCEPGPAANVLGCTPLKCALDADCPGGYCVAGGCSARLGACVWYAQKCTPI